MSLVDDELDAYEAAIENAKYRIAYGKHFPARQLALTVIRLRESLLDEYGSLEEALDELWSPSEPEEEVRDLVMWAKHVALNLLQVTLINPKRLRLIGEAFKR